MSPVTSPLPPPERVADMQPSALINTTKALTLAIGGDKDGLSTLDDTDRQAIIEVLTMFSRSQR